MKHLAVIMDGNGRYAVARGKERVEGHRLGAEAFERAVEDLSDLPIDILTVYAFSTENGGRPQSEVSNILDVIAYFLQNRIYSIAKKKRVNIRFIGNIDALPEYVKEIVFNAPFFENAEKTVVIALNYGGWDEVCRAAEKISRGGKKFSEEELKNNLDASDLPFPDAVLRYGGYKRLSNFMPLQTAYSELFFTDKYWPEYDKNDFLSVIENFGKIKRNFGGV